MRNKMHTITMNIMLLSTTMSYALASSNNVKTASNNSELKGIENTIKPDVKSSQVQINILSIDWDILTELVNNDPTLSSSAKTSFNLMLDIADPIQRDRAMQKAPYYKYMSENLYPLAVKSNR